MDVYVRGLVGSSAHEIQSEDDMVGAMDTDVKKGPWTDEEDVLLMNYVRVHGEGRWNLVAHFSGLKRTGKSCRLRWLNYLRPDVRRGNITLEEQLLILELHSRWGNRWSKIAKYLPGRTDNEIKNYWRTRVQKQAKQLKCDVNSKEFRDAMRNVWMPQMAERIQRASSETSYTDNFNTDIPTTGHSSQSSDRVPIPEISGVTSESNSDAQFSPVSDMSECYHPLGYVDNNPSCYNYPNSQSEPWPEYSENRSGWTSTPSGPDMAANMFEEMSNVWLGGGETSMESFWNDENVWFLQQQLSDEDLI